jgi:class 3 adenylate cyclase
LRRARRHEPHAPLGAILAADVTGYSRLIGADEEGTPERLKSAAPGVSDKKIAEHHGGIVKTTGDRMLVEFASIVDRESQSPPLLDIPQYRDR